MSPAVASSPVPTPPPPGAGAAPPPVAAAPPSPAGMDAGAAASAGAPTAKPIVIKVSNDPPVRLSQMDGFFRRNPGFVRTEGVSDAIRGAIGKLPHTKGLLDFLAPTELGVGQLIHDQMQWQINSKRQPDNPWWMRMNHQLVADPLTAEAYIRSGREEELTSAGQKAWAAYIHASDKVRAVFGIEPDQVYTVNKDGMRVPTALGDAWRGAKLLDRIKVQAVYKEQARAALWHAHMASLHDGYDAARRIAAVVEGKQPTEAEFMSSWVNFVGYWAKINPPATGAQAIWAQQHLLPEMAPVDRSHLAPLKRLFVKALATLDRSYEQNMKGKSLDEVTREHPDAQDPNGPTPQT